MARSSCCGAYHPCIGVFFFWVYPPTPFQLDHIAQGSVLRPITKDVLIEKLYKQYKIMLEPEQILLEQPISKFGQGVVPVQLGDSTVNLRYVVFEKSYSKSKFEDADVLPRETSSK